MPPIPYSVASGGLQLWTHSETISGDAGDTAPPRVVPPGTPSQTQSFGFSFSDPGTAVIPANALIWSATPELRRVRSAAYPHQYNFGATYHGYGFMFASFAAIGGGTTYDNWYRMDGAFVQTGDGVGTNTPPRPPLDRSAVFSDDYEWHVGWQNTNDPSNPFSASLNIGPTSVPEARIRVVWYYPEGQGPNPGGSPPEPPPPPPEPPPDGGPNPPPTPPPGSPGSPGTPPTPGPPLPPTPPTDCCDGPPGRPPIDPNDPESPRVPPGGGRPWIARCTGGGTVGSYPVASAGESMIGVRDPRLTLEVQFREFAADNTMTEVPAYWACNVPQPDPATYLGGLKKAYVMGVSRVRRALADDNGNYVGSQIDVALNDKDRAALRTRLGSATGKYVWEREGVIRLQSEAGRQAQTHREIFRGVSKGVSLESGFRGTLRFEDAIATQIGRFGPDRALSSRVWTTGLCTVKPMIGTPMQYILGEVSDYGATDPATGAPAAKGLVKLWLVNTRVINGQLYDEYHVAAHAIPPGFDIYGTDLATMEQNDRAPGRVALDLDALGAAGIVLTPYHAGWPFEDPYLDLTDPTDGRVHRVTHIFVASGSAYTDAHKNGTVTLTFGGCGVEDIGDGSGETLTELFRVLQWVYEHLVLPETEWSTGLYPGSPTWADGRALIHSPSFADAQTYSIQRVGGRGYQAGFVLPGGTDGPTTLREFNRWACASSDGWPVWSHGGQLRWVLINDTADISNTPIFREPHQLRRLPAPRYDDGVIEDPVIYQFDYDADLGQWRGEPEQVSDPIAIGRMGNRPRPSPAPVEMRLTRDANTARDVAQRRLLRRKYPQAIYSVELPIDGVDVEPGDVIRIDSQEGAGSGSSLRPLLVREWAYDHGTRRTILECLDLSDILAAAAVLRSGGEPGEDPLDAEVLRLWDPDNPDVIVLR